MNLKDLLTKEMEKLNLMLSTREMHSPEEILKQSQKVDKLIVEYMVTYGNLEDSYVVNEKKGKRDKGKKGVSNKY